MGILIKCMAVGGAGAAGALVRYGVNLLAAHWVPARLFPSMIATFVINITGSFALAYFLMATRDKIGAADPLRLAVAVGFLGAYTTFSTWTYDCVDALMLGKSPAVALLNIIGSVVLGLLAAWAGFALGRA